jgi:predicted RNA binding protein YcfA (HicA-like mRNA interferase family)
MANDFYADLARKLSSHGWAKMKSGGKGSHEKWRNKHDGKIVVVPRSKSRHTANEVLKQAGLPKAF